MENVKLIKSYMDFLVQKNSTITKNIANRDSENYKREDIAFDQFLDKATQLEMKKDNDKHFNISHPSEINPTINISGSSDTEYDADNGEINIEHEMSELAKNTLNFKFASKQIGGYFNKLQGVIKGGNII